MRFGYMAGRRKTHRLQIIIQLQFQPTEIY